MHSSPSDTIARLIRQRRQLLSLTRDQLAERCAMAGLPQLTPAALTNIETGRPDRAGKRRREVTVEELFVLAYVLQANPVDLVIPGDAADDEPYPVTPEVTATAAVARAWVAGTAFLVAPETPMEFAVAIQSMPKARARAISKEWFTPQRQQEWNRQALEYDRQEPEDDAG